MTTPRYSAVFQNRGFLCLWLAQLLSQLADRLFIYVLVVVAYNLTSSNLGVSVPMLSFGLASLLFGIMAGAFVDRWNRKKILLGSDLLRGLLILLMLPIINKSMFLIFIFCFLIYTVTQFFAPAETASIPELVEKQDLIIANSLFMITWMSSSVIGFGLGAPLTNFLGDTNTFILAAILYLISGLFVFFVPLKKKVDHLGVTVSSLFKEVALGFEFIRRNWNVKFSLFNMFLATSALAIISMLAISYAKEMLNIGAKNFGYLAISVGLGMFVAMVALERLTLHIKKIMMIVIGFLISGVIIILLSATTDIKIALLFTFILGIGDILIMVPIQTVLQEEIPRTMRGKIFGFQNMLINFAFTLPLLVFGSLADLVGIRLAFIVLGLILLVSGGWGVLLVRSRKMLDI